ncbi:hypothetical protein GGR56DRAFT_517010 [Xylariaceae sp. FL0804]|nr:hypothetical protein GGR56DRAFT_517010 [Xylariaceae sp. FL0804]
MDVRYVRDPTLPRCTYGTSGGSLLKMVFFFFSTDGRSMAHGIPSTGTDLVDVRGSLVADPGPMLHVPEMSAALLCDNARYSAAAQVTDTQPCLRGLVVLCLLANLLVFWLAGCTDRWPFARSAGSELIRALSVRIAGEIYFTVGKGLFNKAEGRRGVGRAWIRRSRTDGNVV